MYVCMYVCITIPDLVSNSDSEIFLKTSLYPTTVYTTYPLLVVLITFATVVTHTRPIIAVTSIKTPFNSYIRPIYSSI